MIKYGAAEFEEDVYILAKKIKESKIKVKGIYGIPMGGVPVAVALSGELNLPLVDDPYKKKDILVVDDLIDSGKTLSRYTGIFHTAVLHKKAGCSDLKSSKKIFISKLIPNEWIEYFWERNKAPAEDSVIRMLQYIGEDSTRNGLLETPERVVKSWGELYAGYDQDPKTVFKVFDEPEKFGGLVYLRNIEFQSMCEHHMLPFLGEALIAYIPDGPVIGVSKMARLLDIFARRLQIQERIGEQVTEALMNHLHPIGAACLIEAKHLCMVCRGVKKQNSIMGYNSLKGVFLESSSAGIAARSELMALWAKK